MFRPTHCVRTSRTDTVGLGSFLYGHIILVSITAVRLLKRNTYCHMGNCILEGVATEHMNSTLDIELPLYRSFPEVPQITHHNWANCSGGSIVWCVMRESAARAAVGDVDTSCVCVCLHCNVPLFW